MASLPLTSPAVDFDRVVAPRLTLVPTMPAAEKVEEARLSAHEWSIVALAERDGLSSLREPGRLAKAMEALFGLGRPNKLANSRMETLRRIAVFAWRQGWKVPKSELQEFLEAGFTLGQYELIQASIARSRENAKQRGRRR